MADECINITAHFANMNGYSSQMVAMASEGEAEACNVYNVRMDVTLVPDGEVEIYFTDSNGNYDSSFGQNYRFTLRRN
jgi:hypothetical protein